MRKQHRRSLLEMSLEELWELFPIRLTDHQDCWAEWFAEEKALLRSILPGALGIHHIGSTAVPGIWAKPIVDILVEILDAAGVERAARSLMRSGYLCMSAGEGRCALNKGYTEEGFAERVFHVHLRIAGDRDELCFRDYLRRHPQTAKAYESLKLALWKECEHNRDRYTDAKGPFIAACMQKAIEEECGIPAAEQHVPEQPEN